MKDVQWEIKSELFNTNLKLDKIINILERMIGYTLKGNSANEGYYYSIKGQLDAIKSDTYEMNPNKIKMFESVKPPTGEIVLGYGGVVLRKEP